MEKMHIVNGMRRLMRQATAVRGHAMTMTVMMEIGKSIGCIASITHLSTTAQTCSGRLIKRKQ